MLSVWMVKMRAILCLLLATASVLADKNDNRRNKLPFVADAVGNSLPPPSSVPATVGSPVNLLTPDRYEFYTFDESGELVKRLMTLEEIQAIVAAGEEAEGLVTFANENQPTVSFNINQPPYTKVHSVVTNVQNVLKAQMEAHKNKPLIQPTLDTPDVSDSWSLILPSIFGNTGVDIVLDKTSGTVTTPETETLEEHEDDENSLSKEGNNQVLVSSTIKTENKVEHEEAPTTKITTTTTTTTSTTTTTTAKPTTAKPTTAKPTTAKPTTAKPTTAKPTTAKPTTAKPTTAKPTTVKATTPKPTTARPTTPKATTAWPTTAKPSTIRYTTTKPTTPKSTTASPTTVQPTTEKATTTEAPTEQTTTFKPTTKIATTSTRFFVTQTTKKPSPLPFGTKTSASPTKTTSKPRTTTTTAGPTTTKQVIRSTVKATTAKPEVTSKKYATGASTVLNIDNDKINIQPNSNTISSTEKNGFEYEKISTFIPISTFNYITERVTPKPTFATKAPVIYASTTKRSVPSTTTTQASTTEAIKTQPIMTTAKPVATTVTTTSVNPQEVDKFNATTITTQSVSPSTTVSSTEFLTADKVDLPSNIENKPSVENNNDEKANDPLLLFDVAQSFSQIASDLGGNYQPMPTTSNLLDTTKIDDMDLESKENVEMDIPSSTANDTTVKTSEDVDKNNDNFVKISTIDPHDKNENRTSVQIEPSENTIVDKTINGSEIVDSAVNKKPDEKEITGNNNNIIIDTVQKVEFTSTQAAAEPTTIDPILSESMGDLLSQVVNQAPSIVETEKKPEDSTTKSTTTEKYSASSIPAIPDSESTNKVKKDTVSTITMTTTTPEPNVSEKESSKDDEENDVAKQTETSEKQNEDKKSTPNDIKIQLNDKINTTESTEQNFVQISGSADKDNVKVELQTPVKNITKDASLPSKNELKKDKPQTPEIPQINEQNQPSQTEDKNILDAETTTTLTEFDTTETSTTTETMPNKITQSKINNIDTNDKTNTDNNKDKLLDSLPKIDDFKKKIQKINLEEEELINQRNNSWKLIPTLSPPKANEIPKDKLKFDSQGDNENKDIVLEYSNENQGLEVTTRDLEEDVARFSELSNELAFRYWNVIVDDIDKRRSFVFSPYSTSSMLAMIFMGARGATSGEMNEILKLDEMVSFNPHFTLKNISDSIETSPQSGVAVSAFIRELYSDRNKGKILTFYKERAQHFYNGHVEEINFKLISDIIRRRTNLLVKRYSWGKIPEYMKTNNIVMQPPLAAFTANIFQTDCTGTSVEGRDGEMYFVVSPNVRQRRLVPVPAVVYKKGFLAGYDPVLDVTVAALGNTNTIVSTMFLMPGQQGNVVHADDLEKLEQRLLDATPTIPTWNRVLRTLLPRTGLELQIPRFSHKSTFNTSLTLKKMGLKDLFDGDNADLGGLNGPSKDLFLSDMVQLNTFVTCGEGVVGEQHHIEEYPETLSVSQRRRTRWLNDWDEPRDYQRAFHDPHDISDAMHLPLHLRPRQARLPARSTQPARLKFDRPFLYFVRHNPSGMILYFGRYNPRLLP